MVRRYIRRIDSFLTRYVGKTGRSALLVGSSIAGILFIVDYKFNEIVQASGNPAGIESPYKLWWLRLIFGRTRSRLTGYFMDKPIPLSIRPYVFGSFASLYGCNLEELRYPIESYKCLGHFFARTLTDYSRPIADVSPGCMISPCDSEVVSLGDVEAPRVTQVKGSTYNIESFLGVKGMLSSRERKEPKKKLKYCVLYLAPGNYHHFHAPCSFNLLNRRHISGELLPVAKGFVQYFNDIFSVNERVVLSGTWSSGSFDMIAVGAYNVGNIRLTSEKNFRSNELRTQLWHMGGDVDLKALVGSGGEKYLPGQHIGEFRLGSSIVLIFEAPEDFKWDVQEGTKVQLGQRLGGTNPLETPNPQIFAFYGNNQISLEE